MVRNLLKLHRKYLFNKTKIILVIVLLFIVMTCLFVSAHPFESEWMKWHNRIEYRDSYFNVFMIITKMSIILFSSYLFVSCFTRESDQYVVLLISFLPNRLYYYITKQVVIIWVLFIVMAGISTCYLLFGTIFIFDFTVFFEQLKVIVVIFLQSICYGMIAVILIMIFKNSISYVISYILYVTTEIIVDAVNAKSGQLINFLLPSFKYIDYHLIQNFGFVHLIILVLVYFSISISLYFLKELY